MQSQDPGILLCLPVNQYTKLMFPPFFVVVSKNSHIGLIREAVLDKMIAFAWRYDYSPEEQREIDFETKNNFVAYICEFKASRR